MYNLYPYFTNDGSVGLFSPEADDIYHSTYGALTESFEKFIIPSGIKNFIENNKEIKILDVCFGIGYNTKSFLQILFDFISNDTIYTNNNIYNEKIGTDNKKRKVFIHAIDTDKNLALLSPFFISNKTNIKNNKLSFNQEKIKRMLSGKILPKFKLKHEIDIILFNFIWEMLDNEVENLLFDNKFSMFFNANLKAIYAFKKHKKDINILYYILGAFLHNIYYKYISNSYKNALKALKLIDINFKLTINDARVAIKNDNNKYDFIFLDAFTPVKCPCLWTIDFFKLLYEHLENEGMVLTYSNSAAIRNAMINAGFYVGKIYSEEYKKFTGTIAVKNKTHIKHELSEYDLGLINSKAGVFYRDKNLTALNSKIIADRELEVENSDKISSSRFIKDFRRNK